MNCPHCNKPLPENYTASYCPHCGGAVRPEELVAVASSDTSLVPVRVSWLIFFGVLLAPALLTAFSVFLGKGHSNEQASPVIAFFGGAAAGIACGVMLGLRIGRNVGTRIMLSILFSGVLAVVCIMLSFFGCMAAGYGFNLR